MNFSSTYQLINSDMQIIDGKKIAEQIKAEIADEVAQMRAKGLRAPHLATILVGHNGASETYVANKVKACERCGFDATVVRFESNVTETELLQRIAQLNADDSIDGILVQLPLPLHIDAQKVAESISPSKDVDGFHPINVGRAALGLPAFECATPAGILELLHRSGIETDGKHCVIIGRSNIVGRPLSTLLARKTPDANATVTLCHSHTHNLAAIARTADILVAAIGQPHFVTADMVKDGATVVDVGITRVLDDSAPRGYRLAGDVDFEHVAPKCSHITPVPGGVGPMTIAALMRNTLLANHRMIESLNH